MSIFSSHHPPAPSGLGQVTAVVLAGGLGTRLRTVVVDRPKVMAMVANRPFLTYLLEQLNSAGVHKVILCTGYLADQIRDHYGFEYKNLSLSYSQELIPLGTAGALRFAWPMIKTPEVLILNGDSFCDVNLQAFYDFHLQKNALASICLAQADDSRRFGRVETSADGTITSFLEKEASHGPGMINAGIYLLSTPLLLSIPEGRAVSLERELFPFWTGKSFYGYCAQQGVFIDIGTPQSLEEAQRVLTSMPVSPA